MISLSSLGRLNSHLKSTVVSDVTSFARGKALLKVKAGDAFHVVWCSAVREDRTSECPLKDNQSRQ